MTDMRALALRAAEVRRRQQRERALRLARVMQEEPCLKRACWKAGVSYRAAHTYRKIVLPAMERE